MSIMWPSFFTSVLQLANKTIPLSKAVFIDFEIIIYRLGILGKQDIKTTRLRLLIIL